MCNDPGNASNARNDCGSGNVGDPAATCPDDSGCTITITAPACTLIPKGHTIEVEATCSEDGASFTWTGSGGVTVKSGGSTDKVTIEGTTVSAARGDAKLRVACTSSNGNCNAEIALTVFEVTEIEATVKATPPKTERMGNAPADHTFSSTETTDVVSTEAKTLILMKADLPGALETQLVATVTPADIPIAWDARRDGSDHASLGAGLPTVTADGGNSRQAKLKQDEKGAFYIRARGDCPCCTGDTPPAGGFKHMPLTLVEAKLNTDNSATHTAQINAAAGGGWFGVRSGSFNIGAPATEAIHMNATVDVTSGGADGRLHLAKIDAGWVNNERAAEAMIGTYQNGHTSSSLFASNRGSATTVGRRKIFRPGDPAPAVVAAPVLDSGRGSPGDGGIDATLTRSRVRSKTDQPVGQRWIVESVDSPGDAVPLDHGGHPGNLLTAYSFGLFFSANLCFWVDRGTGATPARRSFASVRSYDWTMNGSWTISHGPVAVAVNVAFTIPLSGQASHDPAKDAKDAGCEVRPPTGLSLMAYDEQT